MRGSTDRCEEVAEAIRWLAIDAPAAATFTGNRALWLVAAAWLNRDRILYEKGRRDMALQICALMGVTETELSIMMETNHADQIPR